MGYAARLLASIARLFPGRGGQDAPEAGDGPAREAPRADGSPAREAPPAEESTAAVRCAICGTPSTAPDEPCPLCGGTDVRPPGENSRTGPEPAPGDGIGAERVLGGAGDRTVGSVLGTGDLLSAHDGRWERVEGSGSRYRVTRPDGTVARAGSTDEVRALLFRHYGPPTPDGPLPED